MTSKSVFKLLGGCAVTAFLVAQLFQPNRPAPALAKPGAGYGAVAPDERVASVLKRSCGDCHSNETTWPWYARISPVSWLVVGDVQRGRRQLNFSTASSLSDDQLGELHDVIKFGDMPPKAYTFMHPGAKLTDAEAALLKQWALGELPAK
jgi:hypothetical protein